MSLVEKALAKIRGSGTNSPRLGIRLLYPKCDREQTGCEPGILEVMYEAFQKSRTA